MVARRHDETPALPASHGNETKMSNDRWMYRLCSSEFGPVEFENIVELANNGYLGKEDFVRGPRGDWKPAGEIVGLFSEDSTAEKGGPAPEQGTTAQSSIELPSIASESSAARVVTPADRATLPTAGPSREKSIGPRPLTVPPAAGTTSNPAKAQAPQAKQPAMRDVLASMLDSLEPADDNPQQQPHSGHVSPQRITQNSSEKPQALVVADASTTPATGASPASSATPTPRPVVSPAETTNASREAPSTAQPTAQNSTPAKAVPAPSATATPTPSRPSPVFIPQSRRSFKFDPDVIKKVLGTVAAIAVMVGVGFVAKSALGGKSASGNVVENHWGQTAQLVDQLFKVVESGDPSRLPKFANVAGQRSREIVERLQSLKSSGQNIDPMLTEAILEIHLEAIPPLMQADGLTPENVARLKEAFDAAKATAEG